MKRFIKLSAIITVIILVAMLGAFITAADGTVTFSGEITTANARSETYVTLEQNGNAVYRHTVEASSDPNADLQAFSIEGIAVGEYDMVISKGGALSYTLKGIPLYSDITLSETVVLAGGDINEDGFIDSLDVSLFVFDMGKSPKEATYQYSDINGDGFRDALDVTALVYNMLKEKTIEIYDAQEYASTVLTFDAAGENGGNWWGAGVGVEYRTEGASEGLGYYGMRDNNPDSVLCGNITANGGFFDFSALENGAWLEIDVYVQDETVLAQDGIQFILSFAVTRDAPYENKCLDFYVNGLKTGWNTIRLDYSEGNVQRDFDLENVKFLHAVLRSQSGTSWGIDNLRIVSYSDINRYYLQKNDATATGYTLNGEVVLPKLPDDDAFGTVYSWCLGDAKYKTGDVVKISGQETTFVLERVQGGTRLDILDCDSVEGWWGNGPVYNTTEIVKEGSGANLTTDSSLAVFCRVWDGTYDISSYIDTGYLHFWLYVDNVSALKLNSRELGMFELNDTNSKTISFSTTKYIKNNGWNEIIIPLKDSVVKTADLTALSSFRLFQYVNSTATIVIDDIYVWMPDTTYTIDYTSDYYDRVSGISDIDVNALKAGTSVIIKNNPYIRNGYDFIGWSDGNNIYAPGDSYIIPSHNVTLTAQWEKSTTYTYTLSDGIGSSLAPVDSYAGEKITLPYNTFSREGYSFVGWSDGDKVYRGGTIYNMPAENVTLTAQWDEIEDYQLLSDALGAWQLNDGGSALKAASAIGGATGDIKWGVWLDSATFGQVLDFSTERSVMTVNNSGVSSSKNITVSAWVMAPKRENNQRVIASTDKWKFFIDTNGTLSFEISGLLGSKMSSGVNIVDGKWHHVMAVVTGSSISSSVKFYIDGTESGSGSSLGTASSSSQTLYVGNDSGNSKHFDGSIAELRIYGSAKTPSQVTTTTLVSSDNDAKPAHLTVTHGVLVERLGFRGLNVNGMEVYDANREYTTIDRNNVRQTKKLGFDHIKITVTPNNLIDENGKLIEENLTYMAQDVDIILEYGLPVLICLHPEPNYKETYLADLSKFELLCSWYREFAAYVGDRWSEDEVLIQMMTEPYANNGSVSWSWMSDRMWGAVRNELPKHTIITSSDQSGNLERLKLMSPATDWNLIYSITTYEPYTIGFCGLNTGWWSYTKDVPYPVPEGLTDAQIEEIINGCTVYVAQYLPSELETAKTTLRAYLKGQYDSNPHYVNHYDIGYTAEWNMTRMNSLTEWSNKYGGNIHIMCVEFGCMDAQTARNVFGSHPECGSSDEARYALIKHLREAFEANNIGWSYWLYNGVFTIYDPYDRIMDASVTDQLLARMYDEKLIEDCLGLTPDF